jgi:hypothetical protein
MPIAPDGIKLSQKDCDIDPICSFTEMIPDNSMDYFRSTMFKALLSAGFW